MNDDSKKFFAELAGVAEEAQEEETALTEASDASEGQLTIDVYQTPDSLIVESPVAGVKGDELEVSITAESVTIRGQRERYQTVKEEDFFYQECYWGRFSRSVVLPEEVDAENSEATIKNGVLRIIMPKIAKPKGRKVRVKAG